MPTPPEDESQQNWSKISELVEEGRRCAAEARRRMKGMVGPPDPVAMARTFRSERDAARTEIDTLTRTLGETERERDRLRLMLETARPVLESLHLWLGLPDGALVTDSRFVTIQDVFADRIKTWKANHCSCCGDRWRHIDPPHRDCHNCHQRVCDGCTQDTVARDEVWCASCPAPPEDES